MRPYMYLAAACVAAASAQYSDPRSVWMLNVTRGAGAAGGWPALTAPERSELEQRAAGWFAHSLKHIQWGQAMPEATWGEANMTTPVYFDDLGDTVAWTGQLLAGFVHQYAVNGDKAALAAAGELIDAYDFASQCTDIVGFVPRTWALPDDTARWRAWRAYHGGDGPIGLGDNIFNCTRSGYENWVWQGDSSSRDCVLGVFFGLGSALFTLKGREEAQEQYSTALTVFERVYDRLHADEFGIRLPKPSPNAGVPINPTPTMIAALQRIALSVNYDKYKGADYGLWFGTSIKTEAISPMHKSGYYGNNLLAEVWYMISRFELCDDNADRAAKLRGKMESLTADSATHLQAVLNAYWVAASNGTTAGLQEQIVEATLWDFPLPPQVYRHVNQSGNPVYGPDISCGERNGCSTTAMLVRDRPPNEWVWQIDPTKLAGGPAEPVDPNRPSTSFGGAFLTPYWIWRSAGVPCPPA